MIEIPQDEEKRKSNYEKVTEFRLLREPHFFMALFPTHAHIYENS